MPTLAWIIAVLQIMLWGITFFLLKQKFVKQEKDIEYLQKQTQEQELKLQHLRDKLWSEDKLTGVIVDAVKLSMTEWENEMLKSGLIHTHSRKEDKS